MVPENPYSFLGRPVRTYRDFHGRRAELVKLTGDVRNGQCVSVVGPRRIGKTSLLLQLIDPEARKAYSLGDEHLTLYVSCDRLANLTEGEVYQVILRRMRREISAETSGARGNCSPSIWGQRIRPTQPGLGFPKCCAILSRIALRGSLVAFPKERGTRLQGQTSPLPSM